jgi:energy-coupling factor transporter ATP-binding protein EcfA2
MQRKEKNIRISIENFMGFKNRTDIELGKITLFIGANGSGKSTLRKLLKMLKSNSNQICSRENSSGYNDNVNTNDFLDLLNRSGKNDFMSFTVNDLQCIWVNQPIEAIGNTSYNIGHLKEFVFHPDQEVLFQYLPVDHFDPDPAGDKLKINLPHLIKLIEMYGLLEFPTLYKLKTTGEIDEALEIAKLKSIPEDEIILNRGGALYPRYATAIINYMKGKHLNPIDAVTERLINHYFDDALEKLSLFLSAYEFVDSTYSVFETAADSFGWDFMHKENLMTVVGNAIGYQVRKLEVRDSANKLYGYRLQVNIEDHWYYLNELSEGLRKYINLMTNIDYAINKIKDHLDVSTMIFMEEPESQLHPDLQVRLAEKIINGEHPIYVVETHSVHILRAVQLAVAEGRLSPEEVRIYDFSMDKQEGIQVKHIPLSTSGLLEADFSSGFIDLAREIDMKLWRIQHLNKNAN